MKEKFQIIESENFEQRAFPDKIFIEGTFALRESKSRIYYGVWEEEGVVMKTRSSAVSIQREGQACVFAP